MPRTTMTPPPSSRRWPTALAVAARWLVLLAICWLVHDAARRNSLGQLDVTQASIELLPHVRRFLPSADRLAATRDDPHRWIVQSHDGTPLGLCLTTSPATDDVIGFSGPTNVLIVLDTRQRIVGLEILTSADTPEHVAQVEADERFLQSLQGRTPAELRKAPAVDAVSGATLTSAAILESVQRRLGGATTSLRFPDPLTFAEVQSIFPQAASWRRQSSSALPHYLIYDSQGRRIGRVVRSAPMTDGIIGYQGPTDMLWAFDAHDRLIDYRLRRSYDNTPYTSDVAEDEPMRELLRGRTLAEFRNYDPATSDIEGVSGATITSQTILLGLKRLAELDAQHLSKESDPTWHPTAHDWGTLSVLLGALVFTFTRLRRSRRVRTLWYLVLVGYLGFANGDMVSQALLIGWAQHGIPWRRVAGLAVLVGAAFLVPLATGKPWYCQAVCPFGAAQGLVRGRLPGRLRPRGRLLRVLRAGPAAVLVIVLLIAFDRLPFSAASVEPFHAFLWPVAGVATIMLALLGLAASAAVPMAYCRFGCPTGAILEYARRQRRTAARRRADLAAALLLGLAVLLWAWPHEPRAARRPTVETSTKSDNNVSLLRPLGAMAPTLALSLQSPPAPLTTLTGVAMGTNWELHCHVPKDQTTRELRELVTVTLERLERQLSHWKPNSTVSQFNRSESGVSIDEDMAHLMETSRQVWLASGGAFDVTVGPLVRLWGFGPTGQSASPPSHFLVQTTLQDIGFQNVSIERSGQSPRLCKTRPTIEIDLSAVAKGLAVDQVVEVLQRHGVTACLFGLGGEYRSVGRHPAGRPWRVAIESPGKRRSRASLATVVELDNRAIATSGTYRQRRGNGSHILDPRTGRPVRHHLVQVTVVHRSAVLADAWATALMVLGESDGPDLARRLDLTARFVWHDGSGYHSTITGSWP